MSRNASAGSATGAPALQCYSTRRLRELAQEAAVSKGLSTSALLRFALVEYVARLGLRPGLAEEIRAEALSRRSFGAVATVDPSDLHAPALAVAAGEG
jgi:hypothetical protein